MPKTNWKKERTGGVATKSFKDKSICENVKQEMIYLCVPHTLTLTLVHSCIYVCGMNVVAVCACVRDWTLILGMRQQQQTEHWAQLQTMNDNSNSYDSMLNPKKPRPSVQMCLKCLLLLLTWIRGGVERVFKYIIRMYTRVCMWVRAKLSSKQ